MVRKRKPKQIPLTIPKYNEISIPDIETMRRYATETMGFVSLAQRRARDDELRQEASRLVYGLFERFRRELPSEIEEDYLLRAIGASVNLGWAFAAVEQTLDTTRPRYSDARILNGIFDSANAITDFPEHLQMIMMYSVRCGYYVGRTGDFAGILNS